MVAIIYLYTRLILFKLYYLFKIIKKEKILILIKKRNDRLP